MGSLRAPQLLTLKSSFALRQQRKCKMQCRQEKKNVQTARGQTDKKQIMNMHTLSGKNLPTSCTIDIFFPPDFKGALANCPFPLRFLDIWQNLRQKIYKP